MKTIKINWEVPYENKEDLSESFGTSEKELKKITKLCYKISKENDIHSASDLTVKLLEDGLLKGPAALVLISIALQNI